MARDITAQPFAVVHPYQPRPTHWMGIRTLDAFAMKCYAITLEGHAVNTEDMDSALAVYQHVLPVPARTVSRPGVGFVIWHAGRGADYLILCWWDCENELPMRVFVRPHADEWRPANSRESVCVWDLRIIAHERDAYVRHMLTDARADREAYLADRFDS